VATPAFALLYALVPILVLGAVGFGIWRLASASRAHLTFAGLLSAYFQLVSGVSLIVLLSGLTALLTAAGASLLGPDFSYRASGAAGFSQPAAAPAARAATAQATAANAGSSGPSSVVKPAPTPIPVATVSPELRERQQLDQERQQREGLAQGISLSVVAGVLFVLHWLGRRNVLPRLGQDPRPSRAYVGLMLALFSLTGVITLPLAAAQVSSFYTAPTPLPGTFNQPQPPGGTLALAVAVIPFWVAFLMSVSRAAHRPEPADSSPTAVEEAT